MCNQRNFKCMDCMRDTREMHEYYMVTEDLWDKATRNNLQDFLGMLCVECIEKRIGRELEPNDFILCPLNLQNIDKGSYLLRSRLNIQGRETIESFMKLVYEHHI